MPIEVIPAFGWQKCARITNGDAELIVTLDVGPRILSYKTKGCENVLRVNSAETGKSGEAGYVVRGGHRLWIAPETKRTYEPDNSPVKYEAWDPFTLHVNDEARAPWMVRKEMTITLTEAGSATIQHRLVNEGEQPTELAAWGLTIARPGGWEIIPQPPLGNHEKGDLLPDRIIVPWKYTDLSDPRWRFGKHYWTLRPEAKGASTKLGLLHRAKWIGCALPDALFIKTVPLIHGARYPDLGCNYETFSQGDFLELETLSPLRELAPGEAIEHTERWHLFGGVAAPNAVDETALDEWLTPLLAKIDLS